MKRKYSFLLIFIIFLALQLISSGQIPSTMSFQGFLTDDTGSALPDRNYNLTFRLYDVESGGAALWEEGQLLPISNGVFNAALGSVVPIDLPFDQQYWLGVSIGGENELSPRTKLRTSAYSFNSGNAQTLQDYEVSPTPAPNSFIPLNSEAKFPRSTMPFSINMTTANGDDLNISTSDEVGVASITISDPTMMDVQVSATLFTEVGGDGNGRYAFYIRENALDGEVIAQGWWRPGTASMPYQATTITMIGVSIDVEGPATYYLTAKKYESGANDFFIWNSSMNILWVNK